MDASGTSSLPDSQIDRFMISFSLSELQDNEKITMLKNNTSINENNSNPINWDNLKKKRMRININDEIYQYIIEIEQTIKSLEQEIYISARCLKQIIDLAKGWAMINNKEYVTHQDIKEILPYILRHRIKFLNQDEKFDFIKKKILEKIIIKK